MCGVRSRRPLFLPVSSPSIYYMHLGVHGGIVDGERSGPHDETTHEHTSDARAAASMARDRDDREQQSQQSSLERQV
jgi:hypothetical protein